MPASPCVSLFPCERTEDVGCIRRDRATVRASSRELADETTVVLEADRCGPLRVIYARISERPLKSWRDDTRISETEPDS
jgi:hypothetical protein